MVATKLLMNVKTVFRLLSDKRPHYSLFVAPLCCTRRSQFEEGDLPNLLNWTAPQTLWKANVCSIRHKHRMERVTLIRGGTAK
jgi:hypothetical protein